LSQQINLYSPALLPEREWVTGRNVSLAALALLVVLLLASGVAQYRLATATTRAKAAEQAVADLKSQVQSASQALAAARVPVDKDAELARLQRGINDREQILALLAQGSPKEGMGFAEYFRGLARQAVPGLWLTGFSLGAGGSGLEIRGRMVDQSLLPEYIRRLNKEKVFAGREFAALDVRLPEVAPAAAAPVPTTAVPPRPTLNYVNFILKPLQPLPQADQAAAEAKGNEGKGAAQ